MVNTFTSDRYAQYFRDLRDLRDLCDLCDVVADGRTPVAQAAGTVMRRYATTPATDHG